MGISNYYFRNVRSELVNADYWDFHLTSDDQGQCLDYATMCQDSCSSNFDIVTDKLVMWFDTSQSGTTTDGTSLTSLVEWEGVDIKPSSGITLCDFGLTGVDNGRYDMLSGITVTLTTGDTKVVLYPVTGYTIQQVTFTGCTSAVTTIISGITATTCYSYTSDTRYVTSKGKYDYPYTYRTGSTTPEGCIVGPTVCLNGGFYQGFFKLDFLEPTPILEDVEDPRCGTITQKLIEGDPDATKYDLMPTEFEDGWTMETWIKWDNSYCDGCSATTLTMSGSSATTATTVCVTGNTLNNTFTGNTGFFFYIGTRAENKFQNVFSGETGLRTCHGIPLSPDDDMDIDTGGQSWFTQNSRGLPSCWCPCPTGSTPTILTGATTATTATTITRTYCDQLSENALGFRVLPDGRIGYRKMTVQVGCFNNKDRITGTTMEEGYSENPVFMTGDTFNHVAVTYTAGSGVKNTLPSGTLKFWVNGRVVYRVKDFIGLQLRALDEWSDKQLGVPFNISWGGGTQGLLESQTFGGPDPADQGLDLATYFTGTFDGELSQLRFYEKPLNLMEIRNNFFIDCNRYCKPESFGGSVSVIPNYDGCDECGRGNYKPWVCP
jgi:hypothetical protein